VLEGVGMLGLGVQREVGVKSDCMQGCCVGARPGVRSWWRMVQVTVCTKTNRVDSTARQS